MTSQRRDDEKDSSGHLQLHRCGRYGSTSCAKARPSRCAASIAVPVNRHDDADERGVAALKPQAVVQQPRLARDLVGDHAAMDRVPVDDDGAVHVLADEQGAAPRRQRRRAERSRRWRCRAAPSRCRAGSAAASGCWRPAAAGRSRRCRDRPATPEEPAYERLQVRVGAQNPHRLIVERRGVAPGPGAELERQRWTAARAAGGRACVRPARARRSRRSSAITASARVRFMRAPDPASHVAERGRRHRALQLT